MPVTEASQGGLEKLTNGNQPSARIPGSGGCGGAWGKWENPTPLKWDGSYSPPTDSCYVGKCVQCCQIWIFSREPKICILYAASQFLNAGDKIDLKKKTHGAAQIKHICQTTPEPSWSPVCNFGRKTLIKNHLRSWQQTTRGRCTLSHCVLDTFRNFRCLPSERQEILVTPSCNFQKIM